MPEVKADNTLSLVCRTVGALSVRWRQRKAAFRGARRAAAHVGSCPLSRDDAAAAAAAAAAADKGR